MTVLICLEGESMCEHPSVRAYTRARVCVYTTCIYVLGSGAFKKQNTFLI